MKPYNKENKTKSEEVNEMFNNIAPTYDSLNHILSLNIDRRWRRQVVKIVEDVAPGDILDVATGTGDLAIALSRANPQAKVVGVDPSVGMLAVAKEKITRGALEQQIELRCTAAESLDVASESFDVATVAFGVRNFGDLRGGVSEMVRALRPGGILIVLEFSRCTHWLMGPLYRIYSRWVMPTVGGLLSRDKKAYSYLPESIEEFEQPAEFLAVLEQCGLKRCYNRPQFFGVAQIYIGVKVEDNE
ncbi:MAG: bifunctional demethylmenaquinone methyltransferase/2-methoxy-6-polyprenyl-1,4-benzoquinol methylase UbiE [Rikenellaceae bacterium]